MKKTSQKTSLLIFLLVLLSGVSMSYAELGRPNLKISASVIPYEIEKGGSGTLTVTVSEVGGVDWAKDVTVRPYTLDKGIYISPSESSPVDIDKYGSATFTFTVYVDKSASEGTKTIYIDVDYIDTGWMNIGEDYKSKSTTTTFEVVSCDYLNVYSNPTDADVYVDGYYKGKTPLYLTLSPGMHYIKIEKNGYYPYSTNVYIDSGHFKTINAKLKPKFGYLTIYSVEGANIYIDGKYVGHPPLRKYKLSVGNHRIEVKKEGYNTYSANVYISSGGSKIVKAKLTPKYGHLTVYSHLGIPCDVYLNNKWIGTTPINKYNVKPGYYYVECKIGELPIYESQYQLKMGSIKNWTLN